MDMKITAERSRFHYQAYRILVDGRHVGQISATLGGRWTARHQDRGLMAVGLASKNEAMTVVHTAELATLGRI